MGKYTDINKWQKELERQRKFGRAIDSFMWWFGQLYILLMILSIMSARGML